MVVGNPGLPLPPPWAARVASRVLGARGRVGPADRPHQTKKRPPGHSRSEQPDGSRHTTLDYSLWGHAPGVMPCPSHISHQILRTRPPHIKTFAKKGPKKLGPPRIRFY